MISFAPLAAAIASASGVLAAAQMFSIGRARGYTRRSAEDPRASWGGGLRSCAGRISAPAAPGDLAALIDAAGSPGGFDARQLMAIKSFLAISFLLVALGFTLLVPSRFWLLLVAGAPVGGFLLPDLLLRRRARMRREQLHDELPAIADRILLAVRAGLPLGRALAAASVNASGPLALEITKLDARVALGQSRAAALDHLVRRCPLPEVASLAAAIRRADRNGARLEPALASLAAGVRIDNQRRITERAQGAAPKIQLIVALLLVPAAILCIAAGMIAGLSGG